MIRVMAVLIAVLSMVGCEDRFENEIALRTPVKISPAISEIPEPEPPPPPPPPELMPYEEIIEVEHPSNEALAREKRARYFRGQRQRANHQSFRQHFDKKNAHLSDEMDFQDQDYQRWETGEIAQDVSSFPVERDRILTADTRLMAILEDTLHSQIPGRVIAVVSRDVLSPTGKYVLIPAYSKLICQYQSIEKQGQNRLPLSCHRLLTPSGVNISLQDMQGADQMGRAGLIGEYDNRNMQRYSGAFLMTALSVMPHLFTKDKQGNISNVQHVQNFQGGSSNTAANILSDNLTKVTEQVIEMGLDLKPTVTIERGTLITLTPGNDIVLRKPIKKGETTHEAQAQLTSLLPEETQSAL